MACALFMFSRSRRKRLGRARGEEGRMEGVMGGGGQPSVKYICRRG